MTTIIETLEDFSDFKKRFQHEDSILLHLLSDTKRHPAVNPLAVLFCRFVKAEEDFIVSIDHNDALSIPETEISQLSNDSGSTVYTLGKKSLLHKLPLVYTEDMEMLQYMETNDPLTLDDTIPSEVRHLQQLFARFPNVNRAIPLMSLIMMFKSQADLCKSILDKHFPKLNSKSYLFFSETATTVLQQIEKNGLCVNPDGLLNVLGPRFKGLITDGKVYSDYNLFTSTGRCSNRYGGINFAALPKKDGTRAQFVSRFGAEGELISIDYESFHLRLIADLMGFELPNEPIHQYLGKQYFKTKNLTPEQYEKGKGITFTFLYGTYKSPEMEGLPYFVAVEKYTQELWKEMSIEGFIESPVSKKKIYLHHIDSATPSKVFNYLVQLYETERNMNTLLELVETIKDWESKVVLYTYDAILIDAKKSEEEKLKQIIPLLEQSGKYPVRVYKGENYENLSLDKGKLGSL